MRLPATEKRVGIGNLFAKGDYVALQRKYGFRIAKYSSAQDCGNYVAEHFGLPPLPSSLKVIQELPLSDEGNVVFYGFMRGSRLNIRHYGAYEKGRVISKWGEGPVLEHAIDEVPVIWGDTVLFGTIDDAVRARVYERVMLSR